MKYRKETKGGVVDITAGKYMPTNKFGFGCYLYPCCNKHMRFEFEITGRKYVFNLFAQHKMRITASAFLVAAFIVASVKEKIFGESD